MIPHTGQRLLSDLVAHSKYAQYLPNEERRESRVETIERNYAMHLRKFPHMKTELDYAYGLVKDQYFVPSMRSLQFGGAAIEKTNEKVFNCSFLNITEPKCFSEVMFLLLCGTGVGYSVKWRHVGNLPNITRPKTSVDHIVGDSIEGWADAVDALISAYMLDKPLPNFIYDKVRAKGSRLSTGVIAPGPDKLKQSLESVAEYLETAVGRKLRPIDAHDITCTLADAVLSGGIRRSAMICLFDWDDLDMLTCKDKDKMDEHPHRRLSNNSAHILKNTPDTKKQYDFVVDFVKRSLLGGSGDPGIYFTNDLDTGTNPCKTLDSTILTPEGYITFRQALNRDSLEVVLPDGRISKATKPFKTGHQVNTRKAVLSNGATLVATYNHKYKKQVGETYDWSELGDINETDTLETSYINVHEGKELVKDEYLEGLLHGLIVADGSKRPYRNSYILSVGVNEFDIIPLLEDSFNLEFKSHHQKPNTCKTASISGELAYKLNLLNEGVKMNVEYVREHSHSYKLGWISGLFTADGSVRKDGVELYSVEIKLLNLVQSIVAEFGVPSTLTVHSNEKSYIAKDGKVRNNKKTYKLSILGKGFDQFQFLCDYKATRYEKLVNSSTNYQKNLKVVKLVENYSVEDVYDITVEDDSHCFISSGITTHNCGEISLRENFCNLCDINGKQILDQATFNSVSRYAALVGTMQASYTDFKYLRPIWKQRTEEEALIGVGLTSIVEGRVLDLDLREAALTTVEANREYASMIGINPAWRTTTIKPSGTSTLYLGNMGSGCHDIPISPDTSHYIRRMRVAKTEPIYFYLKTVMPDLIEDCYYNPDTTAVISIPMMVDKSLPVHTANTPIDFLERVKYLNTNWVHPGHTQGVNHNNVSATCNVSASEHDEVFNWLWDNHDTYMGMSVLPKWETGGDTNYPQMPIEQCTEEVFNAHSKHLVNFHAEGVYEPQDMTKLVENLACVGGACDVVEL